MPYAGDKSIIVYKNGSYYASGYWAPYFNQFHGFTFPKELKKVEEEIKATLLSKGGMGDGKVVTEEGNEFRYRVNEIDFSWF